MVQLLKAALYNAWADLLSLRLFSLNFHSINLSQTCAKVSPSIVPILSADRILFTTGVTVHGQHLQANQGRYHPSCIALYGSLRVQKRQPPKQGIMQEPCHRAGSPFHSYKQTAQIQHKDQCGGLKDGECFQIRFLTSDISSFLAQYIPFCEC